MGFTYYMKRNIVGYITSIIQNLLEQLNLIGRLNSDEKHSVAAIRCDKAHY